MSGEVLINIIYCLIQREQFAIILTILAWNELIDLFLISFSTYCKFLAISASSMLSALSLKYGSK